MQNVIYLTQGETVANSNRVRSAQSLIEQLPPWHDGRNSWLLKYGVGEKYQHMRDARNLPWSDFYQAATTQPCPAPQVVYPDHITPAAPVPACYECGRLVSQISSRGRCVFCEEKRANTNANENAQLRGEREALKYDHKHACATVVAHDDELAKAKEQIAALCDQLSAASADELAKAKEQVEALREALDVANEEIKRLESAPKIPRGKIVFDVDCEETDHLVGRLQNQLKGALKSAAVARMQRDVYMSTIEQLKAEVLTVYGDLKTAVAEKEGLQAIALGICLASAIVTGASVWLVWGYLWLN